jgi:hypothetical protein
VCLGVTKKIVKLWRDGKKAAYKLRPRIVNSISEDLVLLKPFLPSEFARKPRSLQELDRWKAVEFRTFCLYTSFVVLKNNIEEKYYKHFLTLTVAIRILSQAESPELITYAESLLKYFVNEFKQLYGRHQVSYNVHGLIHLANDVRKHGQLDSFSAFKYENYLGKLKRLIRSAKEPLKQLHRRLEEIEHAEKSIVPKSEKIHPDKIYFNNFVIKTKAPDNFILTKQDDLIKVTEIQVRNNQHKIKGLKFRRLKSAFSYPCESSKLDIYKVRATDTIDILCEVELCEIKFKCAAFPTGNKLIIVPLLHSQ